MLVLALTMAMKFVMFALSRLCFWKNLAVHGNDKSHNEVNRMQMRVNIFYFTRTNMMRKLCEKTKYGKEI